MQFLEFATPVAIMLIIANFLKYWLDFSIKKSIISKGGDTAEAVKLLGTEMARSTGFMPMFSSLKWGLLAVAVGVSLATTNLYPAYPTDAEVFGIMLIAGGLALLVYHFIEGKGLEK